MPIQVPWSAELTRDEQKRDAVIFDGDADGSFVIDKCKLFIGANAEDKRQTLVGNAKALRRYWLARMRGVRSDEIGSGTSVHVKGPIVGCAELNIVASAGVPTDDDMSLSIGGNFISGPTDDGDATQFFAETALQLIEVFLEQSADGIEPAPPPDP